MKAIKERFFDRDLSWLSFNYRVLQEAKNPNVPILERLRFLAIYSSNLDEFYSVRVASAKSFLRFSKQANVKLEVIPKKLLKKIFRTVNKHQSEFGKIYREELLPALRRRSIYILDNSELSPPQVDYVKKYFKKKVLPLLEQQVIKDPDHPPFLETKDLYFAIKMLHPQSKKVKREFYEYSIIKIPTDQHPRFVVVPDEKNRHTVMFLDDIIRLGLPDLFPKRILEECYAIKLSRDAELYLEDELSGDVVEKIQKSLKKRYTGIPARFLYDSNIPKPFLKYLRLVFKIKKEDLIPGGRYHNFHDLFDFPVPDKANLLYPKHEILPHAALDKHTSMFEAIAANDYMLHFPYQSFDYVIRLMEEAAVDPAVKCIKITLYRVADGSLVANALMKAAKKGKEVVVFNEVQARFDEKSNIYWGKKLEKAGAKVLYSHEGLKVHTKIAYIEREEPTGTKGYAYLGTGNFNEKTARIYCDHALLTCNPELVAETNKIFQLLEAPDADLSFDKLLVAPKEMRGKFMDLIDYEIDKAKAGERSGMTLKMNSLEDKMMIRKLYEASNAGVKIKIIVRGICCLVPGVENLSKNIHVISIVDRYLEHGRIYMFHHGGEEKIYAASADWMSRNLSRRIEVGFPIYDKAIKKELKKIIQLQLKDNTRARYINKLQTNPYRRSSAKQKVRAQEDTYRYLKELHVPKSPPVAG